MVTEITKEETSCWVSIIQISLGTDVNKVPRRPTTKSCINRRPSNCCAELTRLEWLSWELIILSPKVRFARPVLTSFTEVKENLYDVEHPEEAVERERKRLEEEERKEQEDRKKQGRIKQQCFKRKAAHEAQKRTNKMEEACYSTLTSSYDLLESQRRAHLLPRQPSGQTSRATCPTVLECSKLRRRSASPLRR